MPTYVYRCETHGQFEIEKPMSLAGYPESCWEPFCDREAKRVYSAQAFIMRPDGYSLQPGDRGYWNFNRQQELHQLRGPSHTENRFIDASLVERPPDPPVVYSDQQMRDLRGFGEIFDREVRESSMIPEFVRED